MSHTLYTYTYSIYIHIRSATHSVLLCPLAIHVYLLTHVFITCCSTQCRLNQCLVAGDIGGKNLGKASAKEKAGGDEEEEEDEGGEDILRDFVDSDEEGDSDGEEDEEDDEDEEEEEDEEDEEDEEEEEDKEEEDKEHDSRAERNKKRSVSDSATSKQNQGQMMKGNSSKGKEKGKKARR